jgi:putative transcriptional regulator
MSKDMHRLGLMDDETYRKITMREVKRSGEIRNPAFLPLTGDEIRALRERAQMSQAVFARRLNLTAGYVSQLERGARRPSGPTLALLDLIRRKGIEAIL